MNNLYEIVVERLQKLRTTEMTDGNSQNEDQTSRNSSLKSGLKCTKIFSILRSIFWVILAFFALHYISKTVRHLEESKAISAHNSEMLEEISVNSIQAVPLVQSHDFVTTIHPEQSELVDEAKSLNVCFLYGACKESHFIEAKSMDTLQNCMTQCNQDPRCEYVTFNFELLMCQLHETKCKAISSTGCRNCLTSAKHCPYSVPCQVKGQCQGTLEFAMFANAKDCHRICAENEKCLWYSYDQNRCFVFSSCDQIIDYNSSTITQHYSCKPIDSEEIQHQTIKSAAWDKYVYKKVEGDHEHIDCGLYCRHDRNCDFFVHSDHCYLASFRSTHSIFPSLLHPYNLAHFKSNNDRSIATTKFNAYNRFPSYIWPYFVHRSITNIEDENMCAGICLLLDSNPNQNPGSCHFYHFKESTCYIGDFTKPRNNILHNPGTQTIELLKEGFDFKSLLRYHNYYEVKSDLWSMSLKLPFVVKTVINKFWYIYNPNISGHMELNFKNFNVDNMKGHVRVFMGPDQTYPIGYELKGNYINATFAWTVPVVAIQWYYQDTEYPSVEYPRSDISGLITYHP